jgi:flagellar protein FlbD
MIRVTRLNGQPIYLNYMQILYMESIPETKIKLMNGDFYLVKDSIESIQEQVEKFLHDAILFQEKERTDKETPEDKVTGGYR